MAKIDFQESLDRVNKVVSDEQMLDQREKIIEVNRFVRIPGAQWEGRTFSGTDLLTRMDKYPRFEINKIAKEIKRISAEFRNNRINVQFKPADGWASQEISDKLNRRYRADYQESNGEFAITNAFEDAITGGYGAWRLCAEYEDELDPENEDMNISFKPVYDAASCLFFDPNSKEMDKSDAEWCAEMFCMPADAFEVEYGRPGWSINTIPTGRYEDFTAPNNVYIARYYVVKVEKDEVISFINPTTGESAKYYETDIEELIDELNESGFIETKRRKCKRRRVYCGLLDGKGWLDEPELTPFEYIPIIATYGERWFVDGQERIKGHATGALDAQRLENLMVSMLADTATQGNESTPIVDVEQIAGLEPHWAARNKQRPAYLPLRSIKDKNGNIVSAANVSGYTQPSQINPAIVAILQYSGQSIQELTGGQSMDSMPSNLAQETVNNIFTRADSHSGVYMDNLAMAIKYCGKVWLSAARQLYGNGRKLTLVTEDNKQTIEDMSGKIIDKQTGIAKPTNDLSVGKYSIVVDTGADFATRRDATVSKLTPVLQSMTIEDPNRALVMGMIIDNLDGEGLDELRQFNRKQMLLSGVIEPRTEEEIALVQEAQANAEQNKPVDGEVLMAEAEMYKARVKEQENMMNYEIKKAELQLKAVELGKKIEMIDVETFGKRIDNGRKMIGAE